MVQVMLFSYLSLVCKFKFKLFKQSFLQKVGGIAFDKNRSDISNISYQMAQFSLF